VDVDREAVLAAETLAHSIERARPNVPKDDAKRR